MDKTTQPQQLSLSFDVPSFQHGSLSGELAPTTSCSSCVTGKSDSPANSARILDFQSVASKREASDQASLYRQILDSVRHIG